MSKTVVTVGNDGSKKYQFNVETDIAVPTKKERKPKGESGLKYPFLHMPNGASFVVPDQESAILAQRMGLMKPYEVHTKIKLLREMDKGFEEGKTNYRVWRLETKAERLAARIAGETVSE